MKTIHFKCTFQGPFPIDMLRYDNMIPHREADSNAITNSLDPAAVEVPRTIYLRKPVEKVITGDVNVLQPTLRQWKSFGISVDVEFVHEHEIPSEASSTSASAGGASA